MLVDHANMEYSERVYVEKGPTGPCTNGEKSLWGPPFVPTYVGHSARLWGLREIPFQESIYKRIRKGRPYKEVNMPQFVNSHRGTKQHRFAVCYRR